MRDTASVTVLDNGDARKVRDALALDVEGTERAVTDARGLITVSRTFDMLGRPLRESEALRR